MNTLTAEKITVELSGGSDGLHWADTVGVMLDDQGRNTISKAVKLAKQNAEALGVPEYACKVLLRAPNIKGLVVLEPAEDDTANEDSDDELLVFADGEVYLRCHPEYDGYSFAEYKLF